MTHRCRSGIGLRQIVVVLRCLDQQLRGLAEQHRERCRFKARQRGGREAAESERGLVSANGRIVPATDRRACARLTRARPLPCRYRARNTVGPVPRPSTASRSPISIRVDLNQPENAQSQPETTANRLRCFLAFSLAFSLPFSHSLARALLLPASPFVVNSR